MSVNAMRVMGERKSASIFVVILSEGWNEILLVLNKAKALPHGGWKGKKWGLPGGGIEENEGKDLERWAKVLDEKWLYIYDSKFVGCEVQNHAAWREVFEETGFHIDAKTIVFLDREDDKPDHYDYVVAAKIIGGALKTTPGEDTLEARWFSLSRLPEDLYWSHRQRIRMAIAKLTENR